MTDTPAAFLRYLAVEKDASPHTLKSYGNDLRQFESFLAAERVTATELSPRHIRAFLVALHARGLDPVSVGRKLAAVRSWLRFLVRRGVLERNPAREVRGPRLPKKLVSFLPVDEANDLMEAPGRMGGLGGASRTPPTSNNALRDTAILELLYASGLRVSELTGLALDDVDRGARTVRVLGKGRKERVVPFGSKAARALDAWLERRGMTVHRAGTGREAIEMLESGSGPSIVLMDIMTPEMDGYETMKTIRQNPDLRRLPIIALTAKAMKGDRERCLEAGASDYLAKPVNTEQLLTTLRMWLHR